MIQWERTLRALAAEFGCTVEQTKSHHWRLRHPSGWFVITSGTPGEGRGFGNMRALLKRKAKAKAK